MVSNLLITDFNLKITGNKLLLRVTCWQQWKHTTFYHRLQQKTQVTLQTVNYLLTICILYVILFFFLVVLTNNKCYNGWSHLGCLTGCSRNHEPQLELWAQVGENGKCTRYCRCFVGKFVLPQVWILICRIHLWRVACICGEINWNHFDRKFVVHRSDLWTCRETDNGDLYNGETICVCVWV